MILDSVLFSTGEENRVKKTDKRHRLNLSYIGMKTIVQSLIQFIRYIIVHAIKAHFQRYICTMGLLMRINYDDKDYNYTIITKGITKETKSIQINLNDMEYELVCNSKGDWDAVDATVSDHPGLLKAIGRNIKLRYRL